jgi:hypothetical protein
MLLFFSFHFIFEKLYHYSLISNENKTHHHHQTVHKIIFIAKTTVKPHLKSLDNALHNRNHIKRCKEGEFQCESDGVCIVGYKVCNNYNDCSDHSDEKECVPSYGDDYDGNALVTFSQFIFFIIFSSFYSLKL